MRLLKLWNLWKTEQISPREYLGFVIASILMAISGRHDDNLLPRHVSCVTLKGRRFLCRKGTSDYWHLTYTYEPEITEFLSGQRGEVFLDVGAHIGRYAVILAGNFQKVVAAEPLGETFRVLSRNATNNHLCNILLVNEALSEKEGHGEFYIHDNLGECSLIRQSDCRIEVPLTTIDSLLKRLAISPQEVSLVKIDVEGAEQRVLKGAQNLLKQGSAKILVEVWHLKDLQELKNFLIPFDYRVKCNLDGTSYLLEKS